MEEIRRYNLVINPFSGKYIYDNDSLYIPIPKTEDLFDISNITVSKSNYEVILDKNIVGKVNYVFVKSHNLIFIRLYDFDNIEKINLSFDMRFVKSDKIIKSSL